MNMIAVRTFCRIVAWAIVVAGIINPVFALTRRTKPDVALVSDGRLPDPALVDRVERALRDRFTVVRGPSLGASAVVTIGYQAPAESARAFSRAFAVTPEPRLPFVAITSVAAADRPLLQSRLPIAVGIRSVAARGKTLTITLRRDAIAIDRVTREVTSDDASDRIELQFTPSTTGPLTLTVDAQIGDSTPAIVSLVRTVRDERWHVLFFDRRPSWSSTFVRRALETDPRFLVTSRVATSPKGPAVTAGQPPVSLAALASVDLFDVVIVGAPEEMIDSDTAGATDLMRRRGGTVLLLLDDQEPSKHSAALRRLTGVTSWKLTERADPFGTPAASAVLVPTPLPNWLEPIDVEPQGNVGRGVSPGVPAAPSRPTEPPPVWRTSIGRGTLIVSGALDAWRYRDGNDDAFGKFWRDVIADGAQATAAAVIHETPRVEPDEQNLIRSWVESRGGRVFAESAIDGLAGVMGEAIAPASERRPIRPMHSPWWMVPFGVALGAEWWLRRRSGQR